MQVLRLIDEPTSAALALFGIDKPHVRNFDVSIRPLRQLEATPVQSSPSTGILRHFSCSGKRICSHCGTSNLNQGLASIAGPCVCGQRPRHAAPAGRAGGCRAGAHGYGGGQRGDHHGARQPCAPTRQLAIALSLCNFGAPRKRTRAARLRPRWYPLPCHQEWFGSHCAALELFCRSAKLCSTVVVLAMH